MEEADESRKDMMQTLKPSSISSSDLNTRLESEAGARLLYRQFPPDIPKPPGIPPVHPFLPSISPYHKIPAVLPSHSRSLSQPSLFSLDPLPSFHFPDQAAAHNDANAENCSAAAPLTPQSEVVIPSKAHRRSQSDIPFTLLQTSNPIPGLPPLPQQILTTKESPPLGSVKRHAQFVKQETDCEREGDSDQNKSEGDAGDDLISAYMNLDSLDTLNSSGTEEKHDDLDSKASGSKMNGAESSENEAESRMNEGASRMVERKEGNKRSAVGDPVPINMVPRHSRSVSMDSFMGRLNFGEDPPKLPPSPRAQAGQHSRGGSIDGMSAFSLEYGNGEFSGAEMKKIMANEKLAEIAMADPKRAKRILANRQSAARSKERKMRYISELEHKVQTLQTEATTLSAQLTLLQRDSVGIASQNNHLKFRLQAMEQQAQLRDALNEALSAEVQRLKLVTGEPFSASLNHHIQLNAQIFQLQQQFQKQQQQQQQQHTDIADTEMKQ